jgi:tRNA-splicing ligase RtcB
MFQYILKIAILKTSNSITKKIIANKKLFSEIDSTCFEQLNNISKLPNIHNEVIGLSDLHVGYGVPIGSVFASPVDNGIISPEAVGFDIGCGISFIKTNLYKKDLDLSTLKKISML